MEDIVWNNSMSNGQETEAQQPDSDVTLWLEFQSGNKAAYARIYEGNIDMLYRYGCKLVADEALVKDAVQDLFMELWDKRANLGRVRSIAPYLYTALRRKVLDQARRQGKLMSLTDSRELKNSSTSSPENHIIEDEVSDNRKEGLQYALSKLTKRQQEMIHLKFNSQLTYAEIATITGMSVKKVYYHTACALDILLGVLRKKGIR